MWRLFLLVTLGFALTGCGGSGSRAIPSAKYASPLAGKQLLAPTFNESYSLRQPAGLPFGRQRISALPNANISCMPNRLRSILYRAAEHFDSEVVITSGHRSSRLNRRIGGARNSFHLSCMAVDFKIRGVSKYQLATYLKGLPGRGGVGTYCGKSTVHLDLGPKRSWYRGCGRRSTPKKRFALRGLFGF